MKRDTFFSRLNYSIGNEDWRVEKEALQINKDSEVVCITASGDRPLHLLLDDCQKITSIDANNIQNHLLKLKCAAMSTLDYNEYLGFLGALPATQRDHSFQKLLTHLDADASHFWINNQKKLKKGVLYQGDVEKFTKAVAFIAGLFRPKKVQKLFEMDDLDEQISFVEKEWDTLLMRKIFDVVLSRRLSRALAIDPGLYSNVDPSIRLGSYIYDRMLNALKKGLAKENLLISLLFRGKLGEEAFPPYLTPQGFAHIKTRIPRLQVKTENAIDHLANVPSGTYDRFSMSDIASYMNKDGFNQMIKNIFHAAKPGSRFCIRQFSSDHKIPLEYVCHFKREPDLERKLEADDACFVYRFLVGEIRK